MWLCNDGEISSSVVLIITTIKRRGWGWGWGGGVFCNVGIVLTNTLSDVNLMMAGIGRNM